MEITKLEKAALITTGAAAASKTLLWSLGASTSSTSEAIGYLLVVFAWLSFVAFDLVIVAVAMRGWSPSGAITVAVAAVVSALIALHVAGVWRLDALHAAPAVTLAVFTLHLMLAGRTDAAPLATPTTTSPQAAAPITQAVQVNVAAPAALPRTIPLYIAARAAEMAGQTQAAIAAELGTSADTVRRALSIAATAEQIEQVSE